MGGCVEKFSCFNSEFPDRLPVMMGRVSKVRFGFWMFHGGVMDSIYVERPKLLLNLMIFKVCQNLGGNEENPGLICVFKIYFSNWFLVILKPGFSGTRPITRLLRTANTRGWFETNELVMISSWNPATNTYPHLSRSVHSLKNIFLGIFLHILLNIHINMWKIWITN